MEPKVLRMDKIEGAWECAPGDLSRFWQRCHDFRCYFYSSPQITPWSRKFTMAGEGGIRECLQGKSGLGS